MIELCDLIRLPPLCDGCVLLINNVHVTYIITYPCLLRWARSEVQGAAVFRRLRLWWRWTFKNFKLNVQKQQHFTSVINLKNKKSFLPSPRRPAVGDVVALGCFLLHGVRRAGARSEEARELLGEEMTSDLLTPTRSLLTPWKPACCLESF